MSSNHIEGGIYVPTPQQNIVYIYPKFQKVKLEWLQLEFVIFSCRVTFLDREHSWYLGPSLSAASNRA